MENEKIKRGIKALVFDAYGTLFDVHSVISLCNELFGEHGRALSQMWRAKQLEYTWLRSLIGRYEDFWQVTENALAFACKAINLPCDTSTRARLMDAYLHLDPYPQVLKALSTLSDYSLTILSNGSLPMLEAAVESAGLEGIFTHVISADEVRIYKPSPRVYQLASQKLGVEEASIGFISSNSFDVVGAKAFGFWVCWVNRSDTHLDELDLMPDVTVSTLTELAEIMKK